MEKIGNRRRLLYFFAALLLTASLFATPRLFTSQTKNNAPDVFVGIDASFASVEDTKQLVDIVKSFTNLFVVGSTAITWNQTRLTEVCQYLNDNELHFMTFAHPAAETQFSQTQWIEDARQKWNSTYLGLYAYDEPGGHQIDRNYFFMSVQEAQNYSDAAATYVKNLTYYLSLIETECSIGDFPVFTSDYALYEFDYRAGYDVIFTEFNWKNNSRQIAIALGRGAATMHGKDWGVMITGNLTDANHQTGQQMYDDMVLAYHNGAKYILVFDYPNLEEGILRQEHFGAIEQFWQYIQSNPPKELSVADRVAYVVPKDYGFGFRGPTDKIWGLWEADANSAQIWSEVNDLIEKHKINIDIIYQDVPHLNQSGYSELFFWNCTIPSP